MMLLSRDAFHESNPVESFKTSSGLMDGIAFWQTCLIISLGSITAFSDKVGEILPGYWKRDFRNPIANLFAVPIIGDECCHSPVPSRAESPKR